MEEVGGLSLTSVMRENPELSVQDALARLQQMKQRSTAAMLTGGIEAPDIILPAAAAGEGPLLAAAAVQQEAASKTERELYVSPLPDNIKSTELNEFLTYCIRSLSEKTKIKCHIAPILSTWLSMDKKTGYVECRGQVDAELALRLDNKLYLGGLLLRIGRPKKGPKLLPDNVSESSNYLMILNLPIHLTPEQILDQLLLPFGEIDVFNLLYDDKKKSKGCCLVKYKTEPSAALFSVLNTLRLGDDIVQVQRVPFTIVPTLLLKNTNKLRPVAPHDPRRPTRVIRIPDLVRPSDLMDEQACVELTDDILEEASSYAQVESIQIPRPQSPLTEFTKKAKSLTSGLGLVFIEFSDVAAATTALTAFRSRSFDGFDIEAHFYPFDLFKQHIFHSDPIPPHLLQPSTHAPVQDEIQTDTVSQIHPAAPLAKEDYDPLFSPHAPVYIPPPAPAVAAALLRPLEVQEERKETTPTDHDQDTRHPPPIVDDVD